MKKGIREGEEVMDVHSFNPNPLNPFPHEGDAEFGRLYNSVTQNPDWLEYNKIVYDEESDVAENMILSGNKRWRCLVLAGYTVIPKRWVISIGS